LNLARHLKTGYHGRRWTAQDVAVLARRPDAEVARRVGRSVEAVRQKREELGLLNPSRKRVVAPGRASMETSP
jgi:hypothetical protein